MSSFLHIFLSPSYDVELISSEKVRIQQRSRDQSVRCSVSHFLLMSLLNSQLLDLNFLLNHFGKQSPANFSSVVNLSEIAIFLSATVSAQSLKGNSVLSLKFKLFACKIV